MVKQAVSLPYTLDPTKAAEIAREAEAAGWDGVFYWDGIQSADYQTAHDPWIALAAIAMSTTRVRIGTLITPVSRRRPWKLAREAMSLDHLSEGRVTLGVGLGWVPDGGFSKVNEETDRRTRAERLDEGLEILDGLWKAKPFSYSGRHFRVRGLALAPPPVQTPRIPIWTVTMPASSASERRAFRWDGAIIEKRVMPFADPARWPVQPSDIRAMRDRARAARVSDHFDIVLEIDTSVGQALPRLRLAKEFAEAGVTWVIESVWTSLDEEGEEAMRQRIRHGPPKLA